MEKQKQLISESGFCELLRGVCKRVEETDADTLTEEKVSDLFNEVYAGCEFRNFPCLLTEENGYDAALPFLENTFLDDGKKEVFRNAMERAKDLRKGLLSKLTDQKPFPSFSDTIAYLDGYYDLLKKILLSIDLLKDSGSTGKDFIQKILNVDMMLSYDPAYVSFYAPLVLDGLVHVYGAVMQYVIRTADLKINRCRKDYQEVLVSKVLRYFNWSIAKDGRFLRASIPASYSEALEALRKTLNVPVRPMEEWDSYEGIGELRLLDKILYEAEQRLGQTEFHVAFIGDVEYKPMNQLCSLVDYSLRNSGSNRTTKELQVFLHVLTKNKVVKKAFHKGSVHCEFKDYHQQLRQANTVKELVTRNDAVFILDSCDLYTPLTVVPKDMGYIWQLFGEESYLKDYYCNGGGKELSREGGFAGLIESLYIFCYSGKLGRLIKGLNQGLLQYLENYCMEQERKSVYLYISDLAAFQTVDCDENQIIRIEQYNDKKIAIMRISDIKLKEKALPTGKQDSDRIIVFTLWQLVKHIAVRDIDDFLSFFDLSKMQERTGIFTLMKTLVGVDFSNWPDRLLFSYQLPSGAYSSMFEERVKECIENEIMPYFKEGSNNMFYRYFIESFSSFLYGAAKNVNDMLFLHLFKNKHSKLRDVVFIGKGENLEKYLPKQCKYSQKQYYYQTLEDYDTSSQEFALKYRKLQQMEHAEPQLRKEIFGNIKNACELNSYTDSYIYKKVSENL